MIRRQFFLYSFSAYILFSVVNSICFFIELHYPQIGYSGQMKSIELFVSPFIFSILLYITALVIDFVRKRWYVIFPLMTLLVKFLIILFFGYNMYVGDLLITVSSSFTVLFDFSLVALNKFWIQNNNSEIFLITFGMFVYQVAVLYLTKLIVDKISSISPRV